MLALSLVLAQKHSCLSCVFFNVLVVPIFSHVLNCCLPFCNVFWMAGVKTVWGLLSEEPLPFSP